MKLGNLNSTVILIDNEFLNGKIIENIQFYKNLYPQKIFERINLSELLYHFLLNARVEEAGNNISVIYAYKLEDAELYFCDPSDIFWDTSTIETENGNLIIRSFFADENESCSKHFNNMVEMVANNSSVERIILIADNSQLHDMLQNMLNSNDSKSLFLLKNSDETKISLPIHYCNIDYPIAYSLGLSEYEV